MQRVAPSPLTEDSLARNPAGRGFRRFSLRLHLAIMCAGLALPILIFAGFILWHLASAERARLEGDALEAAHIVAADVDRELMGLRAALSILVHSQYLQSGDLDGFYRQVSSGNLMAGSTSSCVRPMVSSW